MSRLLELVGHSINNTRAHPPQPCAEHLTWTSFSQPSTWGSEVTSNLPKITGQMFREGMALSPVTYPSAQDLVAPTVAGALSQDGRVHGAHIPAAILEGQHLTWALLFGIPPVPFSSKPLNLVTGQTLHQGL